MNEAAMATLSPPPQGGPGADADEVGARSQVDATFADFVAGGAEDEITLRENARAWRSLRFRPSVLRDVSSVDTSTQVLGASLGLPVMVAPMGAHLLVHPDGERATASAAGAAGAGYITSTAASVSLEDVAKCAGPARWFQLYWFQERAVTLDLVRRAREAGFLGVVLTVDAPVLGLRRRDLLNRFDPSGTVRWVNLDPYGASRLPPNAEGSAVARYFVAQIEKSITFDDIATLAAELPVVVKGVNRGDDARAAVDAGASAIYVSNHGGRQLDRTVTTVDALRDVVDSLEGAVPVMVDGGLRSGADVAAACSLGAAAAGIGRPVLWAAANGGATGVRNHLGSIADDLTRTMALLGAPSVAELRADLVSLEARTWH